MFYFCFHCEDHLLKMNKYYRSLGDCSAPQICTFQGLCVYNCISAKWHHSNCVGWLRQLNSARLTHDTSVLCEGWQLFRSVGGLGLSALDTAGWACGSQGAPGQVCAVLVLKAAIQVQTNVVFPGWCCQFEFYSFFGSCLINFIGARSMSWYRFMCAHNLVVAL